MDNKLDVQQIFLDNDKLIYYTMKRYFPKIYSNLDSREEYYQIGAIGLLKAIRKYNSNVSAFSTYAIPMIWGEIKRNIRDNNIIHYSRRLINIANDLIYSYNESKCDENYESWIEKSICELDISEHDKNGIRNYILKPIALETQTIENEKTLDTIIASKISVIDDITYNDYVSNIANKLNDRDKKIFYMLLNDNTQSEIAEKIGISQAQVSRIQKQIRIYSIKELWIAEQYDMALDKIYDMHYDKPMNEVDLINICHTYRIDLSKCPKHILEKRIKLMQKNEQKIYSKKSCQKLILKCVMKLLLTNKEPQDNNSFKQTVQQILIKNNYNNESLFKHLQSMVTSQIKSCIDLANKNIEKYEYKHEYEVIIDELDFKPSKFIKNKIHQEVLRSSVENKNKTASNIIDSVINLLQQFRKDNLMIRF